MSDFLILVLLNQIIEI